MDKQIKKYLERRGIRLEPRRQTGGLLGSDGGFDAFLRWFHEDVMMFDSMEYRRRFWREAYQRGYTIGHKPNTAIEFTNPRIHRYNSWLANLALLMAAMGVSAVVWYLAHALDSHIRKLRRPTYYETERLRRARLAAERRRIRRRTTANPCPSPEMLRNAFAHALDTTVNMLRFGSMLEDLECYVDNSIVWSEDKGRIVGRRGGIRQWLHENAPDLSKRYKTVMKYKALAKKFRQAAGVHDPIPAVAILPLVQSGKQDVSRMAEKTNGAELAREYCSEYSLHRQRRDDRTESDGDKDGVLPVEDVKISPTEIAKTLLEACEGTVASLSANLALMVSADFVPRENTARTKYLCGTELGQCSA